MQVVVRDKLLAKGYKKVHVLFIWLLDFQGNQSFANPKRFKSLFFFNQSRKNYCSFPQTSIDQINHARSSSRPLGQGSFLEKTGFFLSLQIATCLGPTRPTPHLKREFTKSHKCFSFLCLSSLLLVTCFSGSKVPPLRGRKTQRCRACGCASCSTQWSPNAPG